ncbi:MAG: polyamine aminopropyltransferase [Myxococcota bacterium]
MGLWYEENYEDTLRLSIRSKRTIATTQSEFQTIEIFESAPFGRVLALDGVFMTSEYDEFFYHEMIVHPALTAIESPRRVLIIGGGDGGTAREVLRHPAVETVVMVEIDRLVVELCQTHLPAIGTAWDDPRLSVKIQDGIAFARACKTDSFDAVILDGSDPIGPAAPLFDERFYQDIRRILAPHGIFSLQSESPMITTDIWVSTQQRLRRCFEVVHPCFAPVPLYATGLWSWTLASSHVDGRKPRPDRIGPYLDDCKYYSPSIHQAAFQIPNYVHKLISNL